MKKLLDAVMILAAMCVSICCVNEQYSTDAGTSGIRVYSDLSQTRTTHTSVDGYTYTAWTKGDKIALYAGEQQNLLYTADQSGLTSDFTPSKATLDVKDGDIVYAFYPYNQYGYKGKSVLLKPTRCQLRSTGLDYYDMLRAEGVVKNNEVNLKFQHIYAILRITLPTSMLAEPAELDVQFLRLYSDKIIAIDTGGLGYNRYNLETQEVEYASPTYQSDDILYGYDEDITGEKYVTCDIVILPQEKDTEIHITAFKDFATQNLLRTVKAPEGGFQAGKVYVINIDDPSDEARENMYSALTSLYESTGGDSWKNNTNWLSDKPLREWYGINKEYTVDLNVVRQLKLNGNNLRGTLPSNFTYLMDEATHIDLGDNAMSGPIPVEVREHPKWQEFGWKIIPQNLWLTIGFDFSDGTGLVVPDGEVRFHSGAGVGSLSEILKQNELTLVINLADHFLEGLSDTRVNYFLDYKNKGLGMIVTVNRYGWDLYEDYLDMKLEMGLPEEIRWADLFMEDIIPAVPQVGTTYLMDKEGNLLGLWLRDYGISEETYLHHIDALVRKHLGEPEEHPKFETEHYTSSDYSRDGEVLTLQRATAGRGIDLVFMGDGYVDRQMDADGLYERDMCEAAEAFFALEPYKSFRNRFNVYVVKVISANEKRPVGGEYRINYDDAVCFEYVERIPEVDLDKVTVVNVVNAKNLDPVFASAFTNMYESGASVAHIEAGGASSIIIHEAGGHGFAKLLDEYIYTGFENNRLPEDEFKELENMIKTEYHQRGWGVNVDTTSDPDDVIWSHFLKDERYQNEVGIWQGAWRWPYDLWRPSENGVMRRDYTYFNAPCREAIYKAIMKASEGDGWVYDFEDFAAYDVINRGAAARKTYSVERSDRHGHHKAPTLIMGSPEAPGQIMMQPF
jgi:hypothetical protein